MRKADVSKLEVGAEVLIARKSYQQPAVATLVSNDVVVIEQLPGSPAKYGVLVKLSTLSPSAWLMGSVYYHPDPFPEEKGRCVHYRTFRQGEPVAVGTETVVPIRYVTTDAAKAEAARKQAADKAEREARDERIRVEREGRRAASRATVAMTLGVDHETVRVIEDSHFAQWRIEVPVAADRPGGDLAGVAQLAAAGYNVTVVIKLDHEGRLAVRPGSG